MDMEYLPRGKKNKLAEVLEKILKRLDEHEKLYEVLSKDVEELKSTQTKWGRRLGEDISILCAGCGKQHTLPYIPGEYRLCATKTTYENGEIVYWGNVVTINKDGTITTS